MKDFLNTLYNYQNILKENTIWNASPGNGVISSKLPVDRIDEILINAKVGLLNSYEYYKSYENLDTYTNGYLNQGYSWWLLNPYNSTSANIWDVNSSGSGANYAPSYGINIRPSITIKSTINVKDGSGTKNDPYTIKGDKEEIEENITLLNTRSSGEYVNLNGHLFRIVETEYINENLTTKLSKVEYIKEANNEDLNKKFASTINFGDDNNTKNDEY